MQKRPLGSSGLAVPEIIFGAYPLGGTNWGPRDDEEALAALAAAFDAGITAVDTAPAYGFGISEKLVGKAIAAYPEKITVMTKVGLRREQAGRKQAFATEDAAGKRLEVFHNGRPDSIREEVDASLVRLGVECIDLVQLHAPDPDVPAAESLGALAELGQAGKLRAVGSSNLSLAELQSGHAALSAAGTGLASEQLHYSLLARAAEEERLPWARTSGVGVLAYSPLDQGLLAGAVPAGRDFPKGDRRRGRWTFSEANRARVNAALEDAVRPIAEDRGATCAQVVLAWTASQPGITAVLAGARRPQHAIENAAAGDLVLGDEEQSRIRRAFEALSLQRPRPSLWDRVRGRLLGR